MKDVNFYTAKEVADIMRVTTRTVYVLMNRRNNRLPNIRAGRLYRIPRIAFERWFLQQAS